MTHCAANQDREALDILRIREPLVTDDSQESA